MKKVIFTLLSVFIFIGLTAQIDRESVLLEITTGTWCPSCPSAAHMADYLHENGYPVAIIENHGPMGYGDPFAIPESVARNSYYSNNLYPTSQIDGSWLVGAFPCVNSVYAGYVDDRMDIQTSFAIEITGSNDGDDYDVNINVEKVGAYSGGNLYVRFALTETHIPYVWQGETECNFVNRLMVPDATGTAVTLDNVGDDVDVPLTFTFDNSWDINNCELIAFIQDDNGKENLHADHIMILDLGGGNPGFQAGFYADATDYCEPPAVAHFNSDCIGDPVSWSWTFEGGLPETSYDENPVITYLDEGSYDVQLIVSDGTDTDTAFYEKYITVHGLPEVAWDEVPEICNEDWDPYTLTEGQPGGGVYTGDYVTDGMYFHPTEAGVGEHTINYTYTDEYGCINSANHTVTVVNCVGIGENQAIGLELFPNPTNGLLNLNISANQFNNADLRIIDAVGKEVYRQNGLNIDGTYSTSIDLSEHPQGIYFVIIKGENQQASKKVFLNK